METRRFFSHEWVFPKIKRQRFFPTTEWVFPKIKRQRFFPNRRLGFSKNKKAGARPYKKKVFSQQTRLGFSYKARDGDTAMKATGRPKGGHIFPKPQDVGGEN